MKYKITVLISSKWSGCGGNGTQFKFECFTFETGKDSFPLMYKPCQMQI
jgi:hypothetical protein